MKTDLQKNIYILSLNGHWDDEAQQTTGTHPFDYAWDKNWHKVFTKSPVTFHAPQKYHLKKNTGKKNSLERPYVYCIQYQYCNTVSACNKRDAKFKALMNELNAVDLSNCGHMTDNAEAYYKLTVPVDKYDQIKAILKKHDVENVYVQVRGTKHYSSYTPEDLENSFEKLS